MSYTIDIKKIKPQKYECRIFSENKIISTLSIHATSEEDALRQACFALRIKNCEVKIKEYKNVQM